MSSNENKGQSFTDIIETVFNIMCIGVLWITFCIPIITFGASSAAAYYTMVHSIKDKEGKVVQTFMKGIKDNMKITMGFSILFFFIALLLAYDGVYLASYGTEFSTNLSYITYVFAAIFIAVMAYLYPCCAQFDEKGFALFRLAFFMTFSHFIRSIMVIFLLVLGIAVIYFIPLGIVIIPGLYCYLKSLIITPVIVSFVLEEEDQTTQVTEPTVSMREIATIRAASIVPQEDDEEDEPEDRIIKK